MIIRLAKSHLTNILIILSASFLICAKSNATTVQFQTVMGNFEVNLFDKNTPKTVENFLTYVKSNAYNNSIIHRSVSGFIVQGGGYRYDGKLPLTSIVENAAVVNEPVYSNLRGTIAMAKLSGAPNSATNQWFFNLADNSANLDAQNAGFTVFGQVTGTGMVIVDSIAALSIFNLGSPLDTLPLRNYTATDAANGVAATDKNFVLITGVIVLDASTDTAVSLTPALNTLISSSGTSSSSGSSGKSSGGGAISFDELLLLLGFTWMSIRKRK